MVAMAGRVRGVVVAAVLVAGAAFSYFFCAYAYTINNGGGFPLDDPWIHLQFARNLHDYGSFSYYKNEMVTAGSTSPLYTLLLAAGFFFTSNEILLSYVLGVAFLLLAGYFAYKLVDLHFPTQPEGTLLSLAALVLVIAETRMVWGALSGMETTLFVCGLLSVCYFYQAKRAVPLGIAGGLLIWTRPEAVILFGAIAVDLLYHRFWVPRPKTRKKSEPPPLPSWQWLKPSLFLAGGLGLLYFGFNLLLSGSIFPNTFAAKLKYYGGASQTNFPQQVFHFLVDGHMTLVAVLAAVGIVRILVTAARREPQTHLVLFLFSLALFTAFWSKLPYLYQEGRYMMPLIPPVILLAVYGLEYLTHELRLLRSRRQVRLAFQVVLIVIVSGQSVVASWRKRIEYAETCRYISDRQVRTARWLHDHTPENAVIGTHDIGAIAFYSGRKVADMVGLVSPEMIERIGRMDKLRQFLVEKGVTHVAVLRNWFEVVNQSPVFRTDERNPEIMEVFAFDPGTTHFTGQDVTRATVAATQYLYQGQFDIAGQILSRAAAMDPENSKVHQLLGAMFLAVGNLDRASVEFQTALRLFPGFLDAQIGVAQIAARQNNPDAAVSQLETIAAKNPNYPSVYRALAEVYSTMKNDRPKAEIYMRRFTELMKSQQGEGE